MGKATAQGTAWESHLRKRAAALGRTARRLAKTAIKHEPDVEVEGVDMLPILAWKHYQPGDNRRKTTRIIAMQEDDFWKLYALDTQEQYGLYVQAKAAQRISVSAILKGLVNWMKHDNLD